MRLRLVEYGTYVRVRMHEPRIEFNNIPVIPTLDRVFDLDFSRWWNWVILIIPLWVMIRLSVWNNLIMNMGSLL